MDFKIGCSGFAYRDWQGIFYPEDLPASEWLHFYAQYFDTLELNASFYRTPGSIFFKNLYKKTPDDFCFVVKIPQQITHIQKMVGVKEILKDFYNVIKNGLQQKLGAVLFQFPGSYFFTIERLHHILENLDSNFTNVVELRHRSWWTKEVYDLFEDAGICFCSVSYPGLPEDVIINSPVVYYRFHGVPKLYYSIYAEDFVRDIAHKYHSHPTVTKAFCLFNNTATRAALENASYLQEYISL